MGVHLSSNHLNSIAGQLEEVTRTSPNSFQKSICTMDMRKQFTILLLLVTRFNWGACKPIFFDAVSQALNEIGNIMFGNNGFINFSGFKPGICIFFNGDILGGVSEHIAKTRNEAECAKLVKKRVPGSSGAIWSPATCRAQHGGYLRRDRASSYRACQFEESVIDAKRPQYPTIYRQNKPYKSPSSGYRTLPLPKYPIVQYRNPTTLSPHSVKLVATPPIVSYTTTSKTCPDGYMLSDDGSCEKDINTPPKKVETEVPCNDTLKSDIESQIKMSRNEEDPIGAPGNITSVETDVMNVQQEDNIVSIAEIKDDD